MRNILAIIIILLSILNSHAEKLKLNHRTIEVLDTAVSEVVYVHVAKDPHKKNPEVNYEMLTIGHNFNGYGGYGDYQIDSTFMADPNLKLGPEEYVVWCKPFEDIVIQMVTNLNERHLEYFGRHSFNNYRYTEPIPEIEWTIHEDTEEILGHTCTKATASWRGRDWTAWFSDIPIDAGPWKFQGLPGLILKLEDATGQHMFEALGFKQDVYPFGYIVKLYCKTTREKYEAGLKEYCENVGQIMEDSGMVFDTPENFAKLKKRRLFYSPIELE